MVRAWRRKEGGRRRGDGTALEPAAAGGVLPATRGPLTLAGNDVSDRKFPARPHRRQPAAAFASGTRVESSGSAQMRQMRSMPGGWPAVLSGSVLRGKGKDFRGRGRDADTPCGDYRAGHGHAAGVRRRGNLGAAGRRAVGRGKDHPLRRVAPGDGHRLRGAAGRRQRRDLQRRRLDGAEGPAQGRHLHPLRGGRGRAGAARRGMDARGRGGPAADRGHHRLGDRRAGDDRRDFDHPAGQGAAAGVAVLHSREPDQSRLGAGVDPARVQGAEPFGGHRLLDRGACDRRRERG